MIRAPHLRDDRLLDCYFAERRGEAIDPPDAEHLADCDSCGQRYADLDRVLTSVRQEADAEVDAWFPPERLRAQQQAIARRLEHAGRAARVISFPGPFRDRRIAVSASRLATRWVAAAAAAGLFVGVAAGSFLSFGPRLDIRSLRPAGARQIRSANFSTRLTPSPEAVVAAPGPGTTDTDDVFMLDLERALDRPHTGELGVFDALTPHVREIRDVEFAR